MEIHPLLLTVLLVTASLAWLPAGQSHPETDLPNDIDIHQRFDGDTFSIALRSDQAFKVLNNSHFIVTGFFEEGINNTGEARQDAGAMLGVIRYFRSGCNGCFFSMIGDSIKDASDSRVATHGPVTYTFDNDPDSAGWNSLGVGINYPQDTTFQGPSSDASQVTYRLFATVPGASQVHVNLHLHVDKPIEILGQVAHDGGFMLTGDDFSSLGHADTMAASGMVDGEATIPLSPASDERIYAYMSPSWFGTTVVAPFGGGVAGTTNTAGAGDYGYESPGGEPIPYTCVVVGGPCGPTLLAMQQTGQYRFFVNAEANVGPADMYVVGFEGPLD